MSQHKENTSDPNREATVKALTELLEGGHAHATFESAVNNIPPELIGVKTEILPYSIWQLVVHIRMAQWDILQFCKNADHQSPAWPEGYWPSESKPAQNAEWDQNLTQIKNDRDTFIGLLQDPKNDLYAPFPHGDGQNLLREAMLIADHTAYHVGQIIVIRKILGIW